MDVVVSPIRFKPCATGSVRPRHVHRGHIESNAVVGSRQSWSFESLTTTVPLVQRILSETLSAKQGYRAPQNVGYAGRHRQQLQVRGTAPTLPMWLASSYGNNTVRYYVAQPGATTPIYFSQVGFESIYRRYINEEVDGSRILSST